MMFNEYMEHSNQCAGYYSVTRKEEISIQQTDTNRFRQKWLETSGGSNYAQPPQIPTPPLAQAQFNNAKNKKDHQHFAQHGIKQEPHGFGPNQAQPGYPPNGQYKQNGAPPPPMQHIKQEQHVMMKQQQMQHQQSGPPMQYQQQHPQSKYYEPQFIPNMKDNGTNHKKQPQKRQSPSPMILNNNNNINNSNPANYANPQHQQHNYDTPANKFGMHMTNPNPKTNGNNNINNNNNKPSHPSNTVPQQNHTTNNNPNYGNNSQQKMFHHNPAMMQQSGNAYSTQQHPGQVHPGMHQQNPNYKPPYQQQPQHPQSNYMQQQHHQQQQQQQNYHQNQKPPPPSLPHQPQQHQQQINPHTQQKSYANHDYSLELKTAPRVNSPHSSNPSPYPQIHSNGVPDTNSPKDTWNDSNKRDLVSPSLTSSSSFSKKISSSSLVQQQQQPLPIKSPAPQQNSIEPKILNDIQKSSSPVRMMTQSPSNSSLNTSICVPTPINTQQSLIDLNQDQLIADDCDSGSLLSPLNTQTQKPAHQQNSVTNNNNSIDQKMNTSSAHQGCQNTKSSILSEINIDELFCYYPKVFEELLYSFKLNSIEQIEHDLRTYCEQQFKLNFSSKSSNCSASNGAQQFSIRI